MNKLTIPAILVATVMVAGIFAFIPIEQASTVHTTIQGTQQNLEALELTDTDVNAADTYTIDCTTDAVVIALTITIAGTITDLADDIDVSLTVGGEDVGAPAPTFITAGGVGLIGADLGGFAIPAADTVIITQGTFTTDVGDETAVIKAAVLTSDAGTCTLT